MIRWWRRRSDAGVTAGPELGRARPPLETIDVDNFLEATSGRLTMVDFWAPWCGPCRAFAPVFEEVARHYGDRVAFATCNVDRNRAVAAVVQIQAIPTVVLFGHDGSELDRISGFLSRRQLEQLVAGALRHAAS